MKPSLLLSLLIFSLVLSLSALAQADTVDCLGNLFANKLRPASRNKITLVLPGGKRSSFNAFWKDNDMEQYGLAAVEDLDGVGAKELVIFNYTGGAHCCDEVYIFKSTGPNHYTQTARLFAGGTCFLDSVFTFDFHESYGYFFTCYACGLDKEGKHKSLRDVSNVRLRYAAGKMNLVPGAEPLRRRIVANLGYLKKLGWDGGVREGDFDDGRRKELALNLAVFHFSFGQSTSLTKQLFTTYYPWKDADAIWKEFAALLANVKMNMSL